MGGRHQRRAYCPNIGRSFRYLGLVEGWTLQQGVPDQFRWKLTQSGTYTSKSAYAAFFVGTIKFAPWKRIWKSWAPLRCKFFIWWATNNWCWMADRLAKRSLPHSEACPFCDQDEETIQHILVRCVFTRQIWFSILQALHLPTSALNVRHQIFLLVEERSSADSEGFAKGLQLFSYPSSLRNLETQELLYFRAC